MCVGDLMYECICVTVCLGAYESGFAMYKCPNIDVLDGGGGEHTPLSA